MKKNKIMIIVILIVFFLVYLSFGFNTYSFNTNEWGPDNQKGGAVINDIGNTIVGLVSIVGSAVSIITLLILGIKYMMGSVEERAEYKKTMLPYIVGAIMVFGISNIIGIIEDIAASIF